MFTRPKYKRQRAGKEVGLSIIQELWINERNLTVSIVIRILNSIFIKKTLHIIVKIFKFVLIWLKIPNLLLIRDIEINTTTMIYT